MKKIFYFILALTIFASCSDDNKKQDDGLVRSTLTFEGAEWDALVDAPQYYGNLLYGGEGYFWYDEKTDLYSELTNAYGDNKFWGGGVAVSNYFSTDYTNNNTYAQQLTVYANGANSGKNCVVCNGYKSMYGDSRPFIRFADSKGYIESLYVCLTTYSYAVATSGDGSYTPALNKDEFIKIVATGYTLDDSDNEIEGSSSEFYLYKDGVAAIEGWTKWDLKSLGEVSVVRFDIQWSGTQETLSQPAYFAIDDITVAKNQ